MTRPPTATSNQGSLARRRGGSRHYLSHGEASTELSCLGPASYSETSPSVHAAFPLNRNHVLIRYGAEGRGTAADTRGRSPGRRSADRGGGSLLVRRRPARLVDQGAANQDAVRRFSVIRMRALGSSSQQR